MTCLSPSGTTLHRWPTGWRLVPPPALCQQKGCTAPAAGLLTWHDKMGRLNDFAGCVACARVRRTAVEAEGFVVRASRLDDLGEQ